MVDFKKGVSKTCQWQGFSQRPAKGESLKREQITRANQGLMLSYGKEKKHNISTTKFPQMQMFKYKLTVTYWELCAL